MEAFGIEEVASSRSASAPGWAYVPDTALNPAAHNKPLSRKRAARNQLTSAARDAAASRHEAKVFQELADLDKDSHRDVSITVSRATQGKQTPNVRRIIQSHKTFANHLSDFDAFAAHAPTATSTPASTSAASTPQPGASHGGGKRQLGRRKEPARATLASGRGGRGGAGTGKQAESTPAADAGTSNSDSDGVQLKPFSNVPTPHPADADPLLQSRVPLVPSPAEMAALLAAPPLTYSEARATFTEAQEQEILLRKKPPRRFCEICGYWGRVKCTRCGGRVCGLQCLRTHQEDCFTRYGA